MSLKKQVIAVAGVISLLASNIGLVNFASADRAEDGSWIPAPGVTCAEAQSAINNLDESANSFGEIKHGIRIVEDCAANLVIPSGKTVLLSLYSEDENGQRTYHSLTNNGGDTITVEEGASFYYESSDTPEEYIANTTEGQAIINNHGKVHILTGTFKAENGAYTFMNSGELNVMGNKFIGTKLQNSNAGKIRISGGFYDDIEAVRPYVVNSRRINEATNEVVSAIPNGDDALQGLYHFSLGDKVLPIGYSFTITTDYPDYADMVEMKLGYVDNESVLKVTGSNQEGWTFTVVGAGRACAGQSAIYAAGDAGCMTGYEAHSSTQDDTTGIIKYLLNKLDELAQLMSEAINNGKTISIEINIGEKSDGSDVAEEKKVEIEKIVGSDEVLGYFDINLALKADNTEIDKIHDLGDDTVEVRLPVTDLIKDLEAVKSGYKRNYYVVRYHEDESGHGVAEKIDAQLDGDDLVFRSGKFSTYAVAYNDTKITSRPTDGSTGSSSNTNTGSSNNSSTGNNGSNSSSSNSSNAGVNAPDTGIAAYLGSSATPVALAGLVVTSAVAGFAAYRVASRKQRHSK